MAITIGLSLVICMLVIAYSRQEKNNIRLAKKLATSFEEVLSLSADLRELLAENVRLKRELDIAQRKTANIEVVSDVHWNRDDVEKMVQETRE